MSTILFLLVLFTMTFVTLLINAIFLTHRLQQLGYYNLKFIKWIEGNQYREILLWNIFELLIPLLIILFLYFNMKFIPIYKYITSTIMFITFLWKIIHPLITGLIGNKNAKVPLVYTARIKRLLATLIFVIIIVLIFVFRFTATPLDSFTLETKAFFKLNAFLLFISVISPILVLSANLLNTPIEKSIGFMYFQKAKKKLENVKMKRIAITGSYGKTSTKFYLASILSEKYKTLFTPASYNTPMGISKIINTNNINDYEIFVAEMGADQKGDINNLCNLVRPDYGIITAIDFQHLETFGNINNIIETKLSLFNNLPASSFGVYNYDSVILRENIAKNTFKIKLYSYSADEENKADVDIIAKDIIHTINGLEFKAVFKTGEELAINTELLGRHNANNLIASILTAKLLGLSLEEIQRGIKKIKPVEHRLQKIISNNGIIILDDAFNSNIKGAYEALAVLKEIKGNKKIIVTPGFIALGDKEDETNRLFGNYIARFADLAILVGEQKTKNIYEGIIEENFDKNNIIIVNSLNEAKDVMKNIVNTGDVVLFENDLPDTFNE